MLTQSPRKKDAKGHRLPNFACLLSAIAVCCAPINVSSAQSPNVAAEITKILETGWKPSAGNYTSAQEQFTQTKQAAPNDVRVDYAMALVSLQNHNLADASTHLEQALQSRKSLLPIRRLQVWVLISRRDTAAVKTAIAELVRVLKSDSSASNQAEIEETVRWLGGVMGFYSGPGSNQLKPEELAELNTQISSGCKDGLETIYSDAKIAAGNQYSQLKEQLAEARKNVQEENESKLAIERNQTDAALNIATKQKSDTTALLEQLQQKFNAENPVLNAEGLQLSRQWDRVDNRLQNLQSQLDSEKRKPSKDQDSSRISQLNRDIDREQDDVKKSREPLERRMREIRNQIRANANNLDAAKQQLQTISKRESVLSLKSKQLANQAEKSASGNDPKIAPLEQKVTSISTYAGINLAREKQRILDTFRQKQSAP
jgi:hypothetical protein